MGSPLSINALCAAAAVPAGVAQTEVQSTQSSGSLTLSDEATKPTRLCLVASLGSFQTPTLLCPVHSVLT